MSFDNSLWIPLFKLFKLGIPLPNMLKLGRYKIQRESEVNGESNYQNRERRTGSAAIR